MINITIESQCLSHTPRLKWFEVPHGSLLDVWFAVGEKSAKFKGSVSLRFQWVRFELSLRSTQMGIGLRSPAGDGCPGCLLLTSKVDMRRWCSSWWGKWCIQSINPMHFWEPISHHKPPQLSTGTYHGHLMPGQLGLVNRALESPTSAHRHDTYTMWYVNWW